MTLINKSVPIIICILVNLYASGQNPADLRNPYQAYFQESRETIYLHLNKSAFFPGEMIWFTAYVYDRKSGNPNLLTKNLICGLYNSDGKQMLKEIIYVNEGTGNGYFKIGGGLSPGKYVIKAATRWMQNFDEVAPYYKSITILGADSEPNGRPQIAKENSVQLLAEGGHLISGILNSIGFIAQDETGTGLQIKSAKVTDSKGNRHLSNIPVINGMGKFNLSVEDDLRYNLVLDLYNGEQLTQQLPGPEKNGIGITINNIIEDKITIALKTNKATLQHIQGKDFYLAIHRDGLITANTFQFSKAQKIIKIGKGSLLPGVNILTVFDSDYKPLSERLVYNNLNTKTGRIKINQKELIKAQDSVMLHLDLYSKTHSRTSLSISVLPETTLNTDDGNSIISSFLLEPYLRGPIANASEYFKVSDRKALFKLDLLLLIHGWSKYDWSSIFKGPPGLKYNFEDRFNIRGKITNNSYGEDEFIAYYGNKTTESSIAEINNNREFLFENVSFYKNDSITLSLIGKKGKPVKPEIALEFLPSLEEDNLERISPQAQIATILKDEAEKKEVQDLTQIFEDQDVVQLNNVTVTEQKKTSVPVNNPALLDNIFYTGLKITEKEVKNTPVLKDLLRRLGFRYAYVAFAPPSLGDSLSIGSNPYAVGGSVGMQPIILPKSPRGGSAKPPIVYLDDVRVQDVQIGTVLNNIPANLLDTPTRHVDEVYYEHTGVDKSNGGSLYIYLKYGSFVGQQKLQSFTKVLTTTGYQKPMAYYNPKYSSYKSSAYLEHGVVHWEGKAVSNDQGKVQLRFPHYGLDKVRLFISGMSVDGTLFSEIKTVNLN